MGAGLDRKRYEYCIWSSLNCICKGMVIYFFEVEGAVTVSTLSFCLCFNLLYCSYLPSILSSPALTFPPSSPFLSFPTLIRWKSARHYEVRYNHKRLSYFSRIRQIKIVFYPWKARHLLMHAVKVKERTNLTKFIR